MTSFTAQFARGADATAFYDRLAADPAAFYATDVTRNRKNGRTVTWTLDAAARTASLTALYAPGPVPADEASTLSYTLGMAETVGYYGSTFGEYPFGSGRRTATLNGVATPASM